MNRPANQGITAVPGRWIQNGRAHAVSASAEPRAMPVKAANDDPEKARRLRAESGVADHGACTMCGEFCAYKVMDDATERERANAAA